MKNRHLCFIFILILTPWSILSETNPVDLQVLKDFKKGIDNSELLGWPDAGEDPCGDQWDHVFCRGTRVSQIQVKEMGLKGTLPMELSSLTMLSNIGLQRNNFTGPLPTFRGLNNLQYAFLDYNNFDSIPLDFFVGLDSLQIIALDGNGFNSTDGWMFPDDLQGSVQLSSLSCMDCNIVGPLPGFLGKMPALVSLKLAGNSLHGEIPASFKGAPFRDLWLNNQNNGGLSGSIDLVTTMTGLSTLWLHGNQFTGSIPDGFGEMSLLKDLNLNGNRLVGLIPDSLAGLPLENLDLNNNQLMGPIPVFKAKKVSFVSNSFCGSKPGEACGGEVMPLIEFLGGVGYPDRLVDDWTGSDPCGWVGLGCLTGKVASIFLPNMQLFGNLSGSIGNLDALTQIKLQNNNLTGAIPMNWTKLNSLKLLDLSYNNLSPPIPSFASSVKVNIDGNPLLNGGVVVESPPSTENPSPLSIKNPPVNSPPSPGNATPVSPAVGNATPVSPAVGNATPVSPAVGNASPKSASSVASTASYSMVTKAKKKNDWFSYVIPLGIGVLLCALLLSSFFLCWRKRRGKVMPPSSLVFYPQDPLNPGNQVKVVVANNKIDSSGSGSTPISECHTIESGNLVISVQVLKKATSNFSAEKELGRGGFGVVYRGDLGDGTSIAVKRMETGVITKKAFDEFQAEIAVLSKVQHRHLVSLLGYSIEGNERILVYEFMPQGALSKHLFHWKRLKLEPLSWKKRLNIALDVARGMEYLHSLAHRSFIHRDLKSSNILLGDDFRAKVSDFGLVKLAPDGEKSLTTRLAGTFGYLAPEYAVTGKITTKADVFSYGVVLMELLTGLMALDGDRPEESQYLASWFWRIRSDVEKLKEAMDATLDVKGETMEGIMVMSELAGHCTAREANQRPDMRHVVKVLGPLVEKWEPLDDESEGYSGIDYSLPLNQMVKGWKEAEGKDLSGPHYEDSKSSIPSKPTGFADSFTSSDGR